MLVVFRSLGRQAGSAEVQGNQKSASGLLLRSFGLRALQGLGGLGVRGLGSRGLGFWGSKKGFRG